MLVADHASSGVNFTAVTALGYVATMRYLPPNVYRVSAAERDRAHAAGLGLGLIWQIEVDRALRGASLGASDGARASREADALGAPPGLRLAYVAADFGASLTQLRGPIADYCLAFRDACPRPTMPYGPYDAMEVLCGERELHQFGWQCAGHSGSGSGSGGSYRCSDGSRRRLSRFTAMFQDVHQELGGSIDRNDVLLTDHPVDWAWGGGFNPQTEEIDMTAEENLTRTIENVQTNLANAEQSHHQATTDALNADAARDDQTNAALLKLVEAIQSRPAGVPADVDLDAIASLVVQKLAQKLSAP
jgi:hypothetical protein